MEIGKAVYQHSKRNGMRDIPFFENDSPFPDLVKEAAMGIHWQNHAHIEAIMNYMSLMTKELKDIKGYLAELPLNYNDPEVMVGKDRAAEILSLSLSCFDKYLYEVEEHLRIPCYHLDGKNLFNKQELLQWAVLYDTRKRGLA
jgi:hypothetical protein